MPGFSHLTKVGGFQKLGSLGPPSHGLDRCAQDASPLSPEAAPRAQPVGTGPPPRPPRCVCSFPTRESLFFISLKKHKCFYDFLIEV